MNKLLTNCINFELCFDCRLCSPLKGDNKNDVANLYEILAGNFMNVVQYNKDNRAFEVSSRLKFKRFDVGQNLIASCF